MYRLSRWWNRIAYRLIRLGQKMIWDQTAGNGYLLEGAGFAEESSEAILCDRKSACKA